MKDDSIELNPEIAKQRQDIYSSLTDLHGINLFSDEFGEAVRREQVQEAYFEEGRLKLIFSDRVIGQDDEQALVGQLFLGEEEAVLSHNSKGNTAPISFVEGGLVILAILAVFSLYLFYFGRLGRKEKKRISQKIFAVEE